MRPTRRQVLIGGATMGAAAGAGLLNAARTPGKALFPPALAGKFALSEALTMAAQRLLLSERSMAREFPASMISRNFPAIGTVDPTDAVYQQQRAAGFARWALPVTGLVDRPLSLSLADLRAMKPRTQITEHSCERGWSAIAAWTGVPLADLLALAGLHASARWIVFRAVDGWWDSLDLFDALHPQTLLAYGMNGQDLPVANGAPLRLRVERQIGWKHMKFIKSIQVTDRLDTVGDGSGGMWARHGYPWYAGL